MAVARKKPDWLVGSSALKGPLLMLVLERPGHAHDLATRLAQRLGPAWEIDPNDIYPMPDRLAKRGLLEGRYEPHPKHPHKQILVYHPTEKTAEAVLEWVAEPVSREPERGELLALLAVAREEDAPEVLKRLEEFERGCYAITRVSEHEIPTDTWMGMCMELARKAVFGPLKGEIEWAEEARAWIKERMASTP
jgi:DNA-binding PadR family transcriptional regulator